jgi:preprotein translocase subunit SecG
MSDFVDTSALLTENKMNGLGLDIARLSSATMGLRSENKTMTVMIVILVVIIIILLVIMYRFYSYTSSVEDLVYGRRPGWFSGHGRRPSRRVIVARKPRYSRYYSDAESDWDESDDGESEW